MRYREDAVTGGVGAPVGDGMTVGTAIYTLALGAGLCFFGIRSRLMWVTVMGGILATASLVYLIAAVLGLT